MLGRFHQKLTRLLDFVRGGIRMMTIRALVLILIGVAVESLIRSVHAQTDVVLLQVGQRLTLSYIDQHSIDCTLRDSWFIRAL